MIPVDCVPDRTILALWQNSGRCFPDDCRNQLFSWVQNIHDCSASGVWSATTDTGYTLLTVLGRPGDIELGPWAHDGQVPELSSLEFSIFYVSARIAIDCGKLLGLGRFKYTCAPCNYTALSVCRQLNNTVRDAEHTPREIRK